MGSGLHCASTLFNALPYLYQMSTITLDEIKRLAIIALVSDDYLMETLVLKGGNAIDLLQAGFPKKLSRSSYDLDFSMDDDFEDLEEIATRIQRTIENTFQEKNLVVFDYRFTAKPKQLRDELKDFWGGYLVSFKVITVQEYERLEGNLEKIRSGAIAVRPNQSSKAEIEISKFEYVAGKMEVLVDGFSLFIYSPIMIVLEKLRAICQQMPAYAAIIPSHSPRPRARDFYDIQLIADQHGIDLDSDPHRQLAAMIFGAKKVPLSFLKDITGHAAIHRQDFQNVVDTLPASERAEVKSFDEYLAFVTSLAQPLTSL